MTGRGPVARAAALPASLAAPVSRLPALMAGAMEALHALGDRVIPLVGRGEDLLAARRPHDPRTGDAARGRALKAVWDRSITETRDAPDEAMPGEAFDWARDLVASGGEGRSLARDWAGLFHAAAPRPRDLEPAAAGRRILATLMHLMPDTAQAPLLAGLVRDLNRLARTRCDDWHAAAALSLAAAMLGPRLPQGRRQRLHGRLAARVGRDGSIAGLTPAGLQDAAADLAAILSLEDPVARAALEGVAMRMTGALRGLTAPDGDLADFGGGRGSRDLGRRMSREARGAEILSAGAYAAARAGPVSLWLAGHPAPRQGAAIELSLGRHRVLVTAGDTFTALETPLPLRDAEAHVRRRDTHGATRLEAVVQAGLFGGPVRLTRLVDAALDGASLTGQDIMDLRGRVWPPGERPARLVFALAPGVACRLSRDRLSAVIATPGGAGWRLRTGGAVLEDVRGGPSRGGAVTLCASMPGLDARGVATLDWSLTREHAPHPAAPAPGEGDDSALPLAGL